MNTKKFMTKRNTFYGILIALPFLLAVLGALIDNNGSLPEAFTAAFTMGSVILIYSIAIFIYAYFFKKSSAKLKLLFVIIPSAFFIFTRFGGFMPRPRMSVPIYSLMFLYMFLWIGLLIKLPKKWLFLTLIITALISVFTM